MKKTYIDLAIGAPRRLAILKRDFEQWFIKNPHAPKDRVTSWRNVRFYTMRSDTGLHQGSNNKNPIWCTHDNGKLFRHEKDCNDVHSRINHTGWYTDIHQDEKAVGIVAMLPHGRFIAGYRWTSNGERVYYPEIYTDEYDAALAADGYAESFAEVSREDSERFNECRELENELDDKIHRLKECLALRNNKRFDTRDEALKLIKRIRKIRDTIKTDYADYN